MVESTKLHTFTFIKEREEVQDIIHEMVRENYDETFEKLKNSKLYQQNKIFSIVRILYMISSNRFPVIDLFVRLAHDMNLIPEISKHVGLGIRMGASYFLSRLVDADLLDGNEYELNMNKCFQRYDNNSQNAGEDPVFLSKLIDEDNVDELKEYLLNPSHKINAILFFTHYGDADPISLIEYSALRGAFKCFKFLYINNAKFDPKIMNFAIMGGNSDIVILLEQRNIHPSFSDIVFSIQSHQKIVFDWLVDQFVTKIPNKNDKITKVCFKYEFYHGLNIFSGKVNHETMFKHSLDIDDAEMIDYILANHDINWIVNNRKNYFSYFAKVCSLGYKEVFDVICKYYGSELRYDYVFPDICRSGNLDFIKYFMSKFEFHINIRDCYGFTGLHYAIKNNDFELVKFLIQHPLIDINCQTNSNESPITLAAKNGLDQMLQFLLEIPGIDVNCFFDCYEIDALGYALVNKQFSCAEILLDDPRLELHLQERYNAQHFDIKTGIIMLAIRAENQQIMERILQHRDVTISQNEKDEIKSKFPFIPQKMIESVPLRPPDDEYDNESEMISED